MSVRKHQALPQPLPNSHGDCVSNQSPPGLPCLQNFSAQANSKCKIEHLSQIWVFHTSYARRDSAEALEESLGAPLDDRIKGKDMSNNLIIYIRSLHRTFEL